MINYIKRHFKQNFYATDCSAIKRKAKSDVNIFFLLNDFIIIYYIKKKTNCYIKLVRR